MQSLFPVHWIRDPVREKHSTLDKVHMYQPPCMRSALDMSFLANPKRKREESVTVPSPSATAPQQKRSRPSENDGAVQPIFQTAREESTMAAGSVMPTEKYAAQNSMANIENMRGSENGPAAPVEVCPLPPVSQLSASHSVGRVDVAPVPLPTCDSTSTPISPNGQIDILMHDAAPVDVKESAQVEIESNLDQVRSVIAAQIDLEILLKHNELRLIEQELAKCQVALEQIRRCELIPFPGSRGVSTHVASGTGPALAPSQGYSAPQYPAPYGTTEGPYTKHYAQWLLPDAEFDSQAVAASNFALSAIPLSGRSTRGFATDYHLPPTPVGRGSRVSSGCKSQLLTHDASQPYRDPLLMKREMDGQWVRLVCTKCKPERANFQNIQGFLNHCRISHQDNYKSHEQAAIACGRPVDVDESTMPPPPQPTGASKQKTFLLPIGADLPSIHRVTAASTPTGERPSGRLSSAFNSLTTGGFVDGAQTALRKLVMPRAFDPNLPSHVSTPNIDSPGSPFTASPQTPHLSELLKRQRFNFDLKAAVVDVRSKVDTSLYDCSDSENENGLTVKKAKQKRANGSSNSAPRRPQVGGRKSGEKSGKLKAEAAVPLSHQTVFQLETTPMHFMSRPTGSAHSLPLTSSTAQRATSDQATPTTLSDADNDDLELSPGTVADSNPGLVSDHEGESDDAEEDAMVDPSSSQSFEKRSGAIAHRHGGSVRPQPFNVSNAGMMDMDTYVEIQDASDGERDSSGARMREGPNVVVTCSSRPGTAT